MQNAAYNRDNNKKTNLKQQTSLINLSKVTVLSVQKGSFYTGIAGELWRMAISPLP